MLFVFLGPGGVGKGTVVRHVMERDPRLWLNRSWTTRPRRPGEAADAYVFVDRDAFLANAEQGGFLEYNLFSANGDYYGSPWPEEPAGYDVILEIDVNGTRMVKEVRPEAVAILVVPPSMDELERRLRQRGDSDDEVAARLQLAEKELIDGRAIADHIVVNDDLSRAVEEVAGIVDRSRSTSAGEP